MIEERAAQLVVPCSAELLGELRRKVEEMRRARRRRDVDAHYKAAVHFHRTLVAASGNRAFLQAWDSQHWQVRARVAMNRLVSAGGQVADFVDSHALILEALEAGDGRLAGSHLRDQIESVQAIIGAPPADAAPVKAVKRRGKSPLKAVHRAAQFR